MVQSESLIQSIVWLIFWIFIIINILFPGFQLKVQVMRTLSEIEQTHSSIKRLKIEAENKIRKIVSKKIKIKKETLENFFKNIMEHHIILPASLDPAGIVEKIEHILNVEEKELERLGLMFYKDKNEMYNFLTSVLALVEINKIDKIITHYLELIKKSKNIYLAYLLSTQLQMSTYFFNKISKSLYAASTAFIENLPVGDSVGPLIALHLIKKSKAKLVKEFKEENCVLLKGKINGREVYLIKASGFGSKVGRIGRAIERTIKERKIKNLITIDAAVKLESEESGTIAEGVGVAIGGIGIDSAFIENIATKNKVNLFSTLVKMSMEEALSPLNKKIYDSAKIVVEKIENRIKDLKGNILIAGIGNTCGIGNTINDFEKSEEKVKKAFQEYEKLQKSIFS
ncbi:MAG: DUF1512 family protein [Candidatus Aenigmatarchaeota archaeon]